MKRKHLPNLWQSLNRSALMKGAISCLLLLLLAAGGKSLYAQCTAPSSIGTPTITHASCPGSGRIIVASMSPSAGSIAPDYYQYALYDTTGANVIAPYQSADTLYNIDAGVYDLYARSVCPSGFSAPITRRVTVLNTELMAAISSITLNRADQCTNGRFTVSATGSTPLQYALVPSLAEPEPVASYVRAPQATNVFDSLAAGTYYVRVYNVCGNAVTQAFTVPTFTATTSFTDVNFNPVGCDSVKFYFRLNNYLNIFGTDDTARTRSWITWPSGITDTLSVYNTSSQGSNSYYGVLDHISKVDPTYNTATSFYENLANYPYVFRFGFKDACGNTYTDSFTLYEPDTTELVLSVSETHNYATCDSAAYNFRIRHRRATAPAQSFYHLYRNIHQFMYSIDSGATWTNATTSNSLSISTTGIYSDYIQVPRNETVELRVAYCGDTLIHTFIPAAQPALSASFDSYNRYSCIDYSGIRVNHGNAVGDSLGVEMLSAPVGQAIIPYFTLPGTATYSFPTQYSNILPGQYTIRFWDTFNVDCPRFIDRTYTISAYDLDFAFNLQCNGALGVYETTVGQQLPSYAYLRVMLLDSLGNTVLGPYLGSYAGYQAYGNVAATIIPAAALDTLPDGDYTIRVYKSLGSSYSYLDTCSIVDKVWLKRPNILTLSPSKFLPGCPGGAAVLIGIAQGGKPPYTFQLTDPSNAVIAPTSPGGTIYNNLDTNTTYNLQVIDSCGTVVNRTMSIGEDLAIFINNFSTMPCPGDDVTLYLDSMPGVTYQWYKNDTAITGATGYELLLPNIQPASDSGAYKVIVQVGTCDILLESFILDPTECGAPLSVHMMSFDARKEGARSVLTWSTASEINNRGYGIQRSANGRDWFTIGFVHSKADGGNSETRLNYQYADEMPLNHSNYYRLEQTDYDGSVEHTPVRVVYFANLSSALRIYPNPSSDIVYIDGMEGTNSVQLITVEGKILAQQTTNSGKAHIDLSAYRSGIYVLTITHEDGTQSHYKVVRK